MSERRKSKEELFLHKLYHLSKEEPIGRYVVGKELGYHSKSTDTIVQNLTKNNFLKKGNGDEIWLTPQGLAFLQLD